MKRALKSLLDDAGLLETARAFLPKYRGAIAKLLKARAAFAAGKTPGARRRLAEAYLDLAKAQLSHQCPAEAAASCARAIELVPDFAEAFLARGAAFKLVGRDADSLSDKMRAVELGVEPASARAAACMEIGDAHFRKLSEPGSLRRALRYHELALAADPDEPDHHMQAGQALLYAGEYERAEKVWARGAALRDEHAQRRGLDARKMRLLGPSWSGFHLTILDVYFKMQDLGLMPESRTVLVERAGHEVDGVLASLWKPRLETAASAADAGLAGDEARLLQDDVWALRRDGAPARFFIPAAFEVQRLWEAQKRPPLLKRSDEDMAKGRSLLAGLGLPVGAWFATLHVREGGYWKQNDEEGRNPRNADAHTYREAIRAITERGGWVVRIGDASMKPLPKEDRVLDLALYPERSTWLDIFALSACRFFVGTASGPSSVPPLFGIPTALTNWVPIGHPLWYGDVLWIPKRMRSDAAGRALSIDEIFDAGLGRQQYARHLEERGISTLDNSADEIAQLVREMMDRLDGKAVYSRQDDLDQERFSAALTSRGGFCAGRLGRDFLRAHADLLRPTPAQASR